MSLYTLEERGFNAKVSVLDETYRYFQITPESGLPFYVRYDKQSRRWKAVAEIYQTDPAIVQIVGEWLSEHFTT